MKSRNPRFGYLCIAQQISPAFGVEIDKDTVRRVLAKHYHADHSAPSGPSWLTFFAQTKDSLFSVDLFRCESILLRSHWVLLVMDVFTRRIIGFSIEKADIEGVSVCRMFNHAISASPTKARQHRPRSTLPISPLAGKSTSIRNRRPKAGSIHPAFPSVRRTIDRDDPT